MFFKKKKKKEVLVEPKKDPFPDYDEIKEMIIIDIRDNDDIEYYGEIENSIHIPFDKYFASKLLMLDKNKKYGIMDLRGDLNVLKEAESIAKEAGIDAKVLRGGFFYLTEVLNVKKKEKK